MLTFWKYLEMRSIKIESLKLLGMAIIALVGITGCINSGTDYINASGEGDYGYSDRQLSDMRYRVSFSGNSNTPVGMVQDYALLRAAELAMDNGYEQFEVIQRVTTPQRLPGENESPVPVVTPPSAPTPNNCDLPGCTTARYSPAYSLETVDFPRRRQKYTTNLEVIMGSGEDTERSEVYNAQEILAAVGAKS